MKITQKKLIILLCCAVFVLFSATVFAKEDACICPDGRTLNVEMIYKHYVPADFPRDLLTFFCTKTVVPGYPMFYWPGFYMGVRSLSGSSVDPIGFTWVFDNINAKYITIIIYYADENIHKVIWISKQVPDGFKEYITDLINEINNRNF